MSQSTSFFAVVLACTKNLNKLYKRIVHQKFLLFQHLSYVHVDYSFL